MRTAVGYEDFGVFHPFGTVDTYRLVQNETYTRSRRVPKEANLEPSSRYESVNFPPTFLMIWIWSRSVDVLIKVHALSGAFPDASFAFTNRNLIKRMSASAGHAYIKDTH